ncbi:Hypothetical predicted protein [Cloeon dipterum]|uniref:Peptidase S1 domain-containing protein n=1 Tax=Cloeon dipterum TaxID=197152 RepID=A0A8S1CDB7_9INSE|nr:Hypothetical predicted protein [Cloeon dipterum]
MEGSFVGTIMYSLVFTKFWFRDKSNLTMNKCILLVLFTICGLFATNSTAKNIINYSRPLIEKKLSFDKENGAFVRNKKGAPGRIAGFSATRKQFPWQALLILDDAYSCGGSLISTEWILTAAHCVDQVINFTVILGTVKRENNIPGSQIFETNTKFIHDSYVDYNLNNDIALLKLLSGANIAGPHVSLIRLPRVADVKQSFKGVRGFVTGWGKTGDGNIKTLALIIARSVKYNINHILSINAAQLCFEISKLLQHCLPAKI